MTTPLIDEQAPIERIDYPLARFDFVAHVSAALGEPELAWLGRGANISLRTRQTDQDTPWHRAFYRTFPAWRAVYDTFIREVIASRFSEPFFFQAVPTLRVHLPGNVAVGEFHTDTQYGHSDAEVSMWLPLTPAFGTNSVWVESAPGRGDYRPVEAQPGQIVIFDACRLRHGNMKNTSGRTRVSFDFRCLRERDYRDTGHRSVNTGLAFAPGGYFSAEPAEPRR